MFHFVTRTRTLRPTSVLFTVSSEFHKKSIIKRLSVTVNKYNENIDFHDFTLEDSKIEYRL